MDTASTDDATSAPKPNVLLRGSSLDGTRRNFFLVADDCMAPQTIDRWWGRETYAPTGELCIVNGRLLAVHERAYGSAPPAA